MEHKVKSALQIQAGSKKSTGAHWFVAECVCGWSSMLCQTAGDANEQYRRHKSGEPAAVRPVLATSHEAFR